MPCATLMKLCTKACINNVRILTDVGDFEYWKIRDVLARVTSPEQLHEIELASPQILGEDEELWKALIARDIPEWRKKNYVPKDPKKWFQVYKKYRKEQQQEIERDAEQLKAAFAGLQKDKQNHVSRVVDPKLLPKLPRDPRMLANNGGIPLSRKKTFAKAAPTMLSWAGGSKTKMTNGASVMLRARREAHELTQRNKLITPTALLASSRVSKAPQSMMDEHRMAAIPAVKIYTPRRKLGGISDSTKSTDQASLDERERRLRALTAPSRGYGTQSSSSMDEPRATVLAFDDDSDDLDELFDEAIAKQPRSASPQKPPPIMPVKRSVAGNIYKPRPQPSIRKVPQPGMPLAGSSGKANSAAGPSRPSQAHKSSTVVSRSSPATVERTTSPPNTTTPKVQSAPTVSPVAPTASAVVNTKSIGSPLRPLIKPKRRAEVDIFNRGGAATAKRSRIA